MKKFKLRQDYLHEDIIDRLYKNKNPEAIRSGVLIPPNDNKVVLLVTLDHKMHGSKLTNKIRGPVLTWIGQKAHKTDKRIANAERLFLFLRPNKRDNQRKYTYFGPIHLENLPQLSDGKQPSVFDFRVKAFEMEEEPPKFIAPDIDSLTTEQTASSKIRKGQNKFRQKLLKLWNESCAVTGLREAKLLTASHIKPWRYSSDKERLNPYNGLPLTPNLDRLFDCGLITFQHSGGHIEISNALSEKDCEILGVDTEMSLRETFPENKEYLEYHKEWVFDAHLKDNPRS